ncbi:MAG TPA: response regulator [Mycobacteriales bacterium]|nr:response regulator [Mycobacteriales bacterium]
MQALVIDDSRAMRLIIRRILETEGFEVREAGDGQEALDLLASQPKPDLALVDWNMPVLDGLEFVSAVRKDPDGRQITLMMVTTENEADQIVRALAAGAHEYLIKPFTPDALLEKLDVLGMRTA